MSSSFEKSVKGATKIKAAPPKAKYVEHILLATQTGEAGVAEVFRILQNRLRDSTWTIVFKALIVVHLMVKEGAKDVTLRYLAVAPDTRLAINTFTDVQTQGQNIRRYSNYLMQRAKGFADTKTDYVRPGAVDRMKSLTIDKGLLRETSAIQEQIRALIKCDFFSQESETEIALMAFRLITKDLLDLYTAMNQAVMNALGRYFELSRPDAERAIAIYKVFAKQTDQVVQYLSVARQYENVTRLEIPKIKHAPTSLTASLQEYLDDNDFDVNRRQYLAEQQNNGGSKSLSRPSESAFSAPKSAPKAMATSAPKPTEPPKAQPQPQKGPAPDLIDFFDSIEQKQQPMAQQATQQYPQQTAQGFNPGYVQPFAQQPTNGQMQTNPFGQPAMPPQQIPNGAMQNPQQTNNPFGASMSSPQQVQPQFTGMGFGGYGPQPEQQFVQQNNFQPQQQSQAQQPIQQPSQQNFTGTQQMQPQSTNPFRQSMMPTGFSSFSTPTSPQSTQQPQQQQQSTNPFARSQTSSAPQSKVTSPIQQNGSFSQPQQIQPQATGTNPFARSVPAQNTAQSPPPPPAQPIAPMVTGSTNPFRQSMFVNQTTGQGWQHGQQGTMGGWEQMQTVAVFPRPGQPQQ